MRKLYLDNIRWITVVLVVVYHVIYMFNGVETFGVIGAFSEVQYQDAFQYLVYPWFMLLLFVVSGMCSRFYLENHTDKEFLKSRTTKLLVPSTIGLFVFQWTTGYYNMLISNAFEAFPKEIPALIKFAIMAVSGTGVLWYIQMLWIFSILLLFVRGIEKDYFYRFCGKANVPVLLLLAIGVVGASRILNTPMITVYRFGIYGFGFFVGYFCLSHEAVLERLGKYYRALLAISVILAIAFVVIYWQQPYAEAVVLETWLCNIYAWISVLAILAFMSQKGNFENQFTAFMKKQSWGLYVFHYLPLAMCAYYMNQYASNWPAVFHYIVCAVLAFVGSYILYEVISRIPVICVLILGMKKRRKEGQGNV